jgi:hypothetical protein
MQKQDGGICPVLCGEIWRRCFTSVAVKATPVHHEVAKLFTSTYDNFIQTAGIRDGASYCAKILSVFYDNLSTSDPNDPDVIIKIDISNVFNTTCRAFTLNVLNGRAPRDYGMVEPEIDGVIELLPVSLSHVVVYGHIVASLCSLFSLFSLSLSLVAGVSV